MKNQWKEEGNPEWPDWWTDSDKRTMKEISRWDELNFVLQSMVDQYGKARKEMQLRWNQPASALPLIDQKAIQKDCRALIKHAKDAVNVYTR